MPILPDEITDEMIDAAEAAIGISAPKWRYAHRKVFLAMCGAAPAPWRPISEAKKDGSRYFLGADHNLGGWVAIGHWDSGAGGWCDDRVVGIPRLLPPATHFMPLPAPPVDIPPDTPA